jgi:hypothetical protein
VCNSNLYPSLSLSVYLHSVLLSMVKLPTTCIEIQNLHCHVYLWLVYNTERSIKIRPGNLKQNKESSLIHMHSNVNISFHKSIKIVGYHWRIYARNWRSLFRISWWLWIHCINSKMDDLCLNARIYTCIYVLLNFFWIYFINT